MSGGGEEDKKKMIEEVQQDEQSRGFLLWEKVKIKIRAVQSFLKIQNNNNNNNKEQNDILLKRKNPYQEDTNENDELEEAVSKKFKDENGDAKISIFTNDSNDKVQQTNTQMEVLEEGSKEDIIEQTQSELNQAQFISNSEENLEEQNENDVIGCILNQISEDNENDSDEQQINNIENNSSQSSSNLNSKLEVVAEHDNEVKKDKNNQDDEAEDEEFEDYEDEEEDEDDEAEDDAIIGLVSKEEDDLRKNEDKLVKEERIYVTEAILDDEVQNVTECNENQNNSSISFTINEEDNVITIKICNREYKIDLSKESVKKNDKLIKIINDMTDLIEQLKIKQNEKIEELKKITDHNQFTALEYFLMKTIDDIFREERQIQNQQWQEEICCICQCDLFENINNYTQEDFLKQLQNSSDDDPINLAHCESHFFHKACLKQMIQSTHIKCPVCSKIYGIMIGDQPPGTMEIYLDKYTKCQGYPNNSTIIIEMRINSTFKNGVSVPSTARVGYLPNTAEARKILDMFKIAFKRRLLYTIGKSVTTGKDNRIIWNGVHFKTSTSGGSSNFGYPDPTYFQRVTQELSLKGIYPKD